MKIETLFEDGKLIPAIIQEYETGQVLMLAYVNEEAFNKMIETKETHFFSRSRNKLWHKGEESGNFQIIKSMTLDCDFDTLLTKVIQQGTGACHTGAYSCFFNKVVDESELDFNILSEIEKQIEDREKNPVPKSYTNYLLDEGVDKIGKKIGEEATETIIAAKNKDKKELTGEISDLLYHILVLAFKEGVSLKDIFQELTKRHSVKGNLKEKNKRGEF